MSDDATVFTTDEPDVGETVGTVPVRIDAPTTKDVYRGVVHVMEAIEALDAEQWPVDTVAQRAAESRYEREQGEADDSPTREREPTEADESDEESDESDGGATPRVTKDDGIFYWGERAIKPSNHVYKVLFLAAVYEKRHGGEWTSKDLRDEFDFGGMNITGPLSRLERTGMIAPQSMQTRPIERSVTGRGYEYLRAHGRPQGEHAVEVPELSGVE